METGRITDKKELKIYPVHGVSKGPMGIMAKVNGRLSIAQYDNKGVTGYTTIEELTRMIYRMEDSLPTINFP